MSCNAEASTFLLLPPPLFSLLARNSCFSQALRPHLQRCNLNAQKARSQTWVRWKAIFLAQISDSVEITLATTLRMFHSFSPERLKEFWAEETISPPHASITPPPPTLVHQISFFTHKNFVAERLNSSSVRCLRLLLSSPLKVAACSQATLPYGGG